MWSSKSLFMYLRVKVTSGKRRVRVRMLMALYVLHQLLLSVEGLLALVPGRHGTLVRAGIDSLHSMLLAVINAPPEEYVRVSMEDGKDSLIVSLRTMGWGR